MTVGHRSKKLVWKRDQGQCFYCGKSLSWDEKTIDHVIPKSKGGPHRVWNLVLACRTCNQVKADSDPVPEHLNIILKRKVQYETMVSVARAIEVAKKQQNSGETVKLLKTLWSIQNAIQNGSTISPIML